MHGRLAITRCGKKSKGFYDYVDDAGHFDAASARAIINGDARRRLSPSHHGIAGLGTTTMGELITWY